jgi:hypothetical protein
VRLVRSSGKLIREVTDDLGVSEVTPFATGCAEVIWTTAAAAMG